MRKGERGANLLLSVVREVVPFYRPDTDGEIFATEKSSVTQISTRSCRSIRFADSARRQRVDHTRSLSVGFLSALRGKGGPETDAREKNTARPTAVTSTDLSLSFSLVFTRFLVFRAFSNEAWIRSTRWDPHGARDVRDWT